MQPFDAGLRCQDVHSGLRNVDPNSPLLAPLADTRIVGMAATVAGLIRGRDVVSDAQALKVIAAYQLDVDQLAFDDVIRILEEAEFVQGVRRSGNKIITFTETVPYYDDLYLALGWSWAQRKPTEIEQQLLRVVDGLAKAPVPVESLSERYNLDRRAIPELLEVGQGSGLVQLLRTIDGDVAYTPFFGFENPKEFGSLVDLHGGERLATEFSALRAEQGLPINAERYPLLSDAVARGVIMAPSVQRPDGVDQPFAALPYVLDKSILTARKPILDKALAVLACLRCAQHYGGFNSLSASGLVAVIDKLLDPNRGFLNPNSAHRRQYQLIYRAGLIKLDPDPRPGGNWAVPRFIDTPDNREALMLARDLIQYGEAVSRRVDDTVARQALNTGVKYTAPMQTLHRNRTQAMPSATHFAAIFEAAMGLAEL